MRHRLRLLALVLALTAIGAGEDADRLAAEELLAALVCAECSTCSDPAERQAVAASVIHRAGTRSLLDLSLEVLAPVQYADISHCRRSRKARARMVRDVRAAMRGADPARGATHFHTRPTCAPAGCWPEMEEVPVPASWRHRFWR